MADFKLVGAVAIKVRPDATAFRRETQRDIDKALAGVEGNVKVKAEVKIDADATEAKVEAEKAAKEISKKKVSMKVGLDHDSVRAAQQRFEKMLEPTKNIKFNLKSDKSIEKARAKLEALAAKAKVKLTYVQDDAGYQTVLDKIAAIRRQKIEKTIKFKTDAASLDKLEAEIRDKMTKAVEPDIEVSPTVRIEYDTDREALQAAIKQIDTELAKIKDVHVDVNLNPQALRDQKKKFEEELGKLPVLVQYTADEAGYQDVLNKIKAIQRTRAEVTVDLNLSDNELKEKAEEIRRNLYELTKNPTVIEIELDRQARAKVEQDAKHLKEMIDNLNPTLSVRLTGELGIAATLAYLGRDRIVTYFAKVSARSVAVAEGTLKSLAGLNVLNEATTMLEKLFTRFDTVALKIATVSTVLGNFANVALYATSSLFAIGDGMVKSLGLLALGPTVLGSLFTTLLIGQAVFKDFGAAIHGIDAAFKRLPPSGQKAALIFRKVFAEVRESISQEFWGKASDSMLRFSETALPAFSRGLSGVAGELGGVFAGILDSFTNLSITGGLDTMFNNLIQMFKNASAGATAFWDALNIIGLRGSEFLPQFGTWLTKISTQFRDFADRSSKNGDLSRWIREGVVSLQEMWKVGKNVVDIFDAIATAALAAGAGGLGDFQLNLRRIADEMNSPTWQAKAATLFRGAREGASELNVGFKDLKSSIGESSAEFSNMLRLFGSIGGGLLSGLGTFFGNQNFQDGALASLQGLKTMMETLTPGIDALANMVGNIDKIAGVAFSNLGTLISRMLILSDDAFSRIAGGLETLTPRLMNTVGSLFLAATPLVIGMAEALRMVLDIINVMPSSFVALGVAGTVFLALRSLASKFFQTLSGTTYFKNLQDNFATTQIAAGRTATAFRQVDGEWKKVTFPLDKFSPTKAVFRDLTSQVGQTTGSLRAMYGIAQQTPATLGPVNSAVGTTRNAFSQMGDTLRRAGGDFTAVYTTARQGPGAMNPLTAAMFGARTAFTTVGTEAQGTARHLGAVYGSFRAAPAAVTPFKSAMTVASTAASATAKSMGGGLMNLLGGPWGIAFLAAGAVVAGFAQKQSDAKAKVDSFTQTLNVQTGAITATTGAMVAANIVAQRNDGFYAMNTGAKSASETIKILGLSIEEVSDIIAKGGPEYDKMVSLIQEGKDAWDQANPAWEDGKGLVEGNTTALDGWLAKMKLGKGAVAGLDLEGLLNMFRGERGAIEGSISLHDLRNDSLNRGAKRIEEFNTAMGKLNSATATGDEKLRALNDALRILNGTPLDLEDAKASVNDQIRSATGDWQEFSETINGEVVTSLKLVGGAFRDAKGNVRDFTDVIDPSTGEINTLGEAGANLRKILKPLAEDTKKVGIEMMTQKKPISEIATYLDQQRAAFIKMGTDAGLSGDLVALAYDHMIGANPKELITLITAQGVDEANGKLRNYKGTLEEIDAYRAVAQIMGDNTVLGVKLADSYKNLSAFDQVIAEATVGLDPTAADAVRVRVLDDLFVLAETNPTVRANMDPRLLNEVLTNANRDLELLKKQRPTPIISAQIDEAERRIQRIKDMMAGLKDTSVKIGVNTVFTETGPKPQGYVARNGIATWNADGNILNGAGRAVKHFAGGGIERHVAQITKPGSPIRVWSEAETQGEAYVPYAMSKRPRSVAILSQVAKDFGFTLSKADNFANGGTVGSAAPSTTNSASVTIGNLYTTDADEAVRKIRNSQLDALAVAGISLNGA